MTLLVLFFLLVRLQVLLLPRIAIKATSLLELSSLIVLLLPDSCLSCSVVLQMKLSHSEITKMPAGIGTPEERGERIPEGEKTLCKWPQGWWRGCSTSALSKLFTASIKPCGGWYQTFRCFPGCFLAFGLVWSKISTPESRWCCWNASWWCNSHIIWGRNQPPALLRCVWRLKSVFLDKARAELCQWLSLKI